MNILYLATNPPIPAWFAQLAEPQGLHLMPYLGGGSDLVSAEAVLLFSPFFVQGQYLSPDTVWKKYCRDNHPDLNLGPASFAVQPAKNCLELSDLPQNLSAFFETALPAQTKPDWEPADTGGLNMMDVLRRFFEGHGTESLMKEMQILLRPTINIGDDLKAGTPQDEIVEIHLSDGDLAQRWERFLSRWKRYFLMFRGLPFYPIFQEIDILTQKIAPFFLNGGKDLSLYAQIGCAENILAIKEKLSSIMPYVEGIK